MKETGKENSKKETFLSDKELFLLRRKRDNQLFLYVICYIIITGFCIHAWVQSKQSFDMEGKMRWVHSSEIEKNNYKDMAPYICAAAIAGVTLIFINLIIKQILPLNKVLKHNRPSDSSDK
ncbi:MAG: hypothetical protein JNK27_13370 [Chitinophagaceae bacterium]|nr:hypothetical protein [Chitinophagaceae bacterium]